MSDTKSLAGVLAALLLTAGFLSFAVLGHAQAQGWTCVGRNGFAFGSGPLPPRAELIKQLQKLHLPKDVALHCKESSR